MMKNFVSAAGASSLLLCQVPISRCETGIAYGLFDNARRRRWKVGNRMTFFRQHQRIMPDRASAIDACHIHHRRIVVVASPDTYDIIGGITHRPVVAEIVGGTRFGSCGTNRPRIACITLLLRVAIEIESATLAELKGTRTVVAQYIGDHEGRLFANYLLALRRVLKDGMTLSIAHRSNSMPGDTHATVGKHAIC